MTETGTVREIKENLVVIAPDRSAACFGCMNLECKSGGGFITAENPKALPLKTGQMVEVAAPGAGIFRQALTAFLPPALGFVAGYTLSRLLFPKAGEGLFAFIGAAFLFIAAFIVYWARKKFPAKREYTVTKIVRD